MGESSDQTGIYICFGLSILLLDILLVNTTKEHLNDFWEIELENKFGGNCIYLLWKAF